MADNETNHVSGQTIPAPPMAAASSAHDIRSGDIAVIEPTRAHQLEKMPATADENMQPKDLLRTLLALMVEVRDLLVTQRTVRDYYTTEQAAKVLGKANWTVREWCRLGRIHAEKRQSGRGRSQEWVISHAELLRIEKEGLLPVPKYRF